MTNFAWNFYLYCLSGSRFREEFKNIMFGCRAPVVSLAEPVCVTEESHVSEIKKRGSEERVTETNDDF